MIRAKHILFAVLFPVCTLLHAEVATYTVTSYHAISLTDGTAPDGSVVTFNSTTASGARVTAGNSATLTVSGYDGQFIRSMTLQMHSNKSGGGGSLHAYLGETEVATIADASFADPTWNGAYAGSESWVNIRVPFERGFTVPDGSVLTIVVEASANSLYVGGCVIGYRTGSGLSIPKVVSFSTGTEETLPPVQEAEAGRGVLLPSLPDPDMVWHFLGWMETQQPHTEVCPAYHRAGTIYFPNRNTTLYALYTNKSGREELVQDTLFASGKYAIVSATYSVMMQGEVNDRKVLSTPVTLSQGEDGLYRLAQETIPEDCRYNIVFTDSTATVQHVASNSFVGYYTSSNGLQAVEREWSVQEMAEHSLCFYHGRTIDGLAYCLYSSFDGKFSDPQLVTDASWTFLLLFVVPEIEPVPALYTTNPRSGMGVETTDEAVVYRVFRLDGTCVMTGATQESLRELQRGMYIICSPHGAEKRMVR